MKAEVQTKWTVVLFSIDAVVRCGTPEGGGATVWVWASDRAGAVEAARAVLVRETRLTSWSAATGLFVARGWHPDADAEGRKSVG